MQYDWLTRLPDSAPPMSTWAPDYSFLQSMQMRANQQYEQGLSEIHKGYAALFNQPVTNTANQQAQQAYSQQAQQQMKVISTKDLSDPRNVAAAENILAPFYQDEMLMQDIGFTKQLKDQYQKAEAARTSNDKDIRSGYTVDSLGPLNDTYQELKNAPRDPNFFKNFSVPQWTPFLNTDKPVQDYMAKNKNDIITYSSFHNENGQQVHNAPGQLTEIHNGPSSYLAYHNIADGLLGSEYNAQFNVMGSNMYNGNVRDYKQTHPGATDDEARSYIASAVQREIIPVKQQYIDNTQAQLNNINTQIQALKGASNSQKNGLTVDQRNNLDQLVKMQSDLTTKVTTAKSELNDFSKPETANSFTNNYIIGQYADAIRKQQVAKYAKMMSMTGAQEILKTDEPFFKQQEINETIARDKNTADNAKLEHEDRQEANRLKELDIYANHPELGGGLNNGNQSLPGIPGSTIAGADATNVENTPASQIVQEGRQADNQKQTNYLYGIPIDKQGGGKFGGLSQILLKPSIGLTLDELNAVNTVQTKFANGDFKLNGNGQVVVASPALRSLYNEAATKIAKASGATPSSISSPDSLTDAIYKLAGNYIDTNTKNKTNLDEVQYYSTLMSDAKLAHDRILDDATYQSKAMTDIVNKDPDSYKNISVKMPNGQYRLLESKDIAPYFPDTMTLHGSDGQDHTFTGKELANIALQGNLDIRGQESELQQSANLFEMIGGESSPRSPKITINGIGMTPVQINGKIPTEGYGQLYNGLNQLRSKYGDLPELGKSMQDLYKKVYSTSKYVQDQTGIVPTIYDVPITGKYADNARLVQDAFLPGNMYSLQDEKGNLINDETIKKEIRAAIGSTGESKYLGQTIQVIPQGTFKGNQIRFTINGVPEDKNNNPKGEFKDIAGKTFTVTVSPDTKSAFLRKIPAAMGREPYDPMYSDDPEKNVVRASLPYTSIGITGQMQLSADKNFFVINVTHPVTDPNTGSTTMKNEQVPVLAAKGAEYARNTFQQVLEQLKSNHLSNLDAYVNNNGTANQQ